MTYDQIMDVVDEIDANSSEVRVLLGVVDFDAPYLLRYDVSLHFKGYLDAKFKVFDFLNRIEMLEEVSVIEQKVRDE